MNDADFNQAVKTLIEGVAATGRNKERLDKAFELNNLRWTRESKKFCGGCVNRVFKRLTDYYNQNKL